MKCISPRQLIERWEAFGLNISAGTLANWRAHKPRKGPPFRRALRRVVYPLADLETWEAANIHANDNADPGDEHKETAA